MEVEQKQEKERLIKEAGDCLKCGRTIRDCKSDRLKEMMKKIATNAVCIGLYNFSRFIVSNIVDGDFTAIKTKWEGVINDFNRYMKIIDNEGENLDEILKPEEINEAINYTIFEQSGGSGDDE